MKQPIIFIIVAAFLLASSAAMAIVPGVFPVQGVLTDADGVPVDESIDITFTLYDSESGDTAVWTDTFSAVNVVDGFFSVYLGSNTVLDFSTLISNTEIWMGMTVAGDDEMALIQLATVPFAYEAQTCRQLGSLTESDINSDFLSTGSVAAGITSTQVTNWDAAYGWGDHADAGYLTSYTETDPVYSSDPAAGITSTQVTNWDAAYGWGDHADAGYLDASDWAVPGTIGSTTPSTGAFTSLSANGTITLLPGGSGGTNGQVLTTNGSGVATWQTPSSSATTGFIRVTSNYTMTASDDVVISANTYTLTLPAASSVNGGAKIHFYQEAGATGSTINASTGDTIWDNNGNQISTMTAYQGIFASDGSANWYIVAN